MSKAEFYTLRSRREQLLWLIQGGWLVGSYGHLHTLYESAAAKDEQEALLKETKKPHHVACDLDGTLAEYTTWQGIEHIGAPVPSALARVKWLLANGHQVSIYTSRVAGDWPEHIKDLEQTRRHIERWCYQHVGRILPITAVKHGWFTEFWDDKALGIFQSKGYPTTRNGSAWYAVKAELLKEPCLHAKTVYATQTTDVCTDCGKTLDASWW